MNNQYIVPAVKMKHLITSGKRQLLYGMPCRLDTSLTELSRARCDTASRTKLLAGMN